MISSKSHSDFQYDLKFYEKHDDINIDNLFYKLKRLIPQIQNTKALNFIYLEEETTNLINLFKILLDFNEKNHFYSTDFDSFSDKVKENKHETRKTIILSYSKHILDLWIPFHNLLSCECGSNLISKRINYFEETITKFLLSYYCLNYQ